MKIKVKGLKCIFLVCREYGGDFKYVKDCQSTITLLIYLPSAYYSHVCIMQIPIWPCKMSYVGGIEKEKKSLRECLRKEVYQETKPQPLRCLYFGSCLMNWTQVWKLCSPVELYRATGQQSCHSGHICSIHFIGDTGNRSGGPI